MNGEPTVVQVRRGWLRRQVMEQQRERLPSTPLELPHSMIEIGGRHAHLLRRGGQDLQRERRRDSAAGQPQRVGDETADHPVGLHTLDPSEHQHVVPGDPGALPLDPAPLLAYLLQLSFVLGHLTEQVGVPDPLGIELTGRVADRLGLEHPPRVEVRLLLPIFFAQPSGPSSLPKVASKAGVPSRFGSPPCSRR